MGDCPGGSSVESLCLKDRIEGQHGGGSLLILRGRDGAVVVPFPVT